MEMVESSSFKLVENIMVKGEIALLRAISPFPNVFSKDFYYKHVERRAWKELRLMVNDNLKKYVLPSHG